MLLLRGATVLQQQEAIAACFNTCSSCEEQQLSICNSCLSGLSFNTCSSCEEQLIRVRRSTGNRRFNTCSSCEEQLFADCVNLVSVKFQYMLLLRGATWRLRRVWRNYNVSIHAPLARSNFLMRTSPSISKVSIHAPLARSNKSGESVGAGGKKFQYMLLLRGATLPNDSVRPVSRFNTCSSCEEQQGVGRGNRPRLVSIPAPLARSNL